MNGRLTRRAVLIGLGLAAAALVVWPRDTGVAAGVLGGGVLVGLSAWAIRGVVDGLLGGGGGAGATGGEGAGGRRGLLVKIFTRHAILALAGYGMMVRLHLDPVGMLIGVTAPVIAAAVESIRVQQAS